MKKFAFIFLFFPLISFGVTIDSYNESNRNSDNSFEHDGPGDYVHQCQSFTTTDTYTLTGASAVLSEVGQMTGTMKAQVWSLLGTYGTNGEPDTLLASSDTWTVGTGDLTGTPTLKTFTFSGAEQITLNSFTDYFVCFYWLTSTGNNATIYGLIGRDSTSPTHGGEIQYDLSGALESWSGTTVHNYPFYVYGDLEETPATGGGDLELSTTTSEYGNIEFGLAIIITLMSLMTVGFIFNTFTRKKPWK